MKQYTFVDLFSGAGGLALGFQSAGFKSIYAVDNEKYCANTYRANFQHEVFDDSIEKVNSFPEKPDIIIGGPPCQGFSTLGRMSPAENHSQLRSLFSHYYRLVEKYRPVVFIVENVPQFLTSEEYLSWEPKLEALGYKINKNVLNAHHYGVPQLRKRGFALASLLGVIPFPEPLPEFMRTTVRDTIQDLPSSPDGKNWHLQRNPTQISRERYRCVPPGGNRFDLMRARPEITPLCWLRKKTGSTDVFGRLEWDKPALTIRTEFFKPEKGRYLHPSEDRPLTHREAARLQTFPDSFIFVGNKIQVARMIGNAVPPRLAYYIAVEVMKFLNGRHEKEISPK